MRLALTRRGEYGVRMMIHLAGLQPDAQLTAAELAEECDVSAGNVPTIVNTLSRAGLLVCSPGRGGGCKLARHPSETTILEIIEAMEGPLEVPHCLLDSRRCHGKDPECALHEVWVTARTKAIDALAGITLEQATAREREIRKELHGRRGAKGRRKAAS